VAQRHDALRHSRSVALLKQPGFPFPRGGFWPSALKGVIGCLPAEMRHADQSLQAPQRAFRSQPRNPALLDVQRRVQRERFRDSALPAERSMGLSDKTSRSDVARARCHVQASTPCPNTVATTSRESNVSTTARQGLGVLGWSSRQYGSSYPLLTVSSPLARRHCDYLTSWCRSSLRRVSVMSN